MTHFQVPMRPSMLIFSIVLVSFLQNVSAFDCELASDSKSFVGKILQSTTYSCPTVGMSSDKMFCCPERNTGINMCCDLADFLTTDLAIMIGVGIVVGILISCFLCCCCCPCCFLYKRRSQPGTVVTVHQPYQAVPAYPVQQTSSTYIVQATYPGQQSMPVGYQQAMPVGYQQTHGHPYQQPPPYSENTTSTASAAYSKQAPYNPNF